MEKPIIGVTVGDPAGIGPEIVLKALQDGRVRSAALPVIFADEAILQQAMSVIGADFVLKPITKVDEINPTEKVLHIVESGLLHDGVDYGIVDGRCGKAAFEYIRAAIEWVQRDWITAVATAPINKLSLKAGDVPFLDHTAMFAHFSGTAHPMTLFMVDRLRIFFLTRHIPLRSVADALQVQQIVQGLKRCRFALQQLEIHRPRIALAALNPHAGEDGLFGNEEGQVLIPAVDQARRIGLDVLGPIPADSVFHLCLQGQFDAVLSLYHDQGHIAAKTYDFHRTISLTMGMPFLRSSVDHGTAFDIAGRNTAQATGMEEAILAAVKYGRSVKECTKTMNLTI